ncbi:MAG TPA: hypothetical protein VM100_11595 [Longimicrobiales bacterium]|nr:hypothetical protein [Longimicrobiales bacterium]
MTEPYKPIDCSIHDQIEDAATRGAPTRIRYLTCEREKDFTDVIVDWFTKDGEEFLRTHTGMILRLDQIVDLRPADDDQHQS